MTSPWWEAWNPDNVTLTQAVPDDSWKTCVLQGVYFSGNDYNGWLGARISSVIVIFITSLCLTLFPVVSKRSKRVRIPKYVYLIARNFGTGVITATAFIHLLDPAYSEIGGWSCVGVTGNWAIYSWCPAIVMASVVIIFLVDLVASVYTERKFGIKEDHNDVVAAAILSGDQDRIEDLENRPHLHEGYNHDHQQPSQGKKADEDNVNTDVDSCSGNSLETERDFEAQFGAFLILEFGVLFHSVMIGLNLGTVGSEFKTLYPVLVFHQAFEGLGIGSRLSMIPFPYEKRWWPYFCCLAYGLTTPIAVSIGLGVRTTYASSSYNVNVISGVLDAISAGILIYTALVELLARDYIFNPHRTKDLRELGYCLFSVLLGTGLMALLGKWA